MSRRSIQESDPRRTFNTDGSRPVETPRKVEVRVPSNQERDSELCYGDRPHVPGYTVDEFRNVRKICAVCGFYTDSHPDPDDEHGYFND